MSHSSEAGGAPTTTSPFFLFIRPTVQTLLAAYLCLAALFSIVVPPFEAPDEIWHFAFIQHLVTERALPVSEPGTQALWRQQGTQAPGYYAAAALLTAWIDQSDFPEVFGRANPHRAIGEPDTTINRNYLIHHREAERFPWRRSILALHVARLFSIFLGAVTVYAVYRTLRLLLPAEGALLGAAFAAFLPQFVFISSSVSNDNGVNAAAALVLWQLTAMLVEGDRPGRSRLLALGVLLGLTLLSKLSGLGLVGVVGLAVLWLAWRGRSVRLIVDAALWTAAPAFLIAGWWYVRNWRLYGDPLAWEMWEANILLRVLPAGPLQIMGELGSLERSFWGLFGWLNLSYPDWVYWALRAVGALVAIGLPAYAARRARRVTWASLVPHAFLLLWLVVLTVSWLRFMRVAPAAQGRYFFAALPVLGLLWALGWAGWGNLGRRFALRVTCGLGLLTLITSFALIRPAYQPLKHSPDSDDYIYYSGTLATFDAGESEISVDRATVSYSGGENVQIGKRTQQRGAVSVFPGDEVQVELDFEASAPVAGDWSLFVHLVDGTGLIVAQLDSMPGGGMHPTSNWRPGRNLYDSYTVVIPETAYAPNRASWQIGFYDHRSGERMPRTDGGYKYTFGGVIICPSGSAVSDCQASEGEDGFREDAHRVPIPLHVQFADNVTMTGYNFSSRLPSPGEDLTVTLYWTAAGPVDESYTIFAHLLTSRFAMFGGEDLTPDPATDDWQAGETVETVHTFTVPPDAPTGLLYQIEIGLYTVPDFRRLRVLDRINPAEEDRILIGPLRIE